MKCHNQETFVERKIRPKEEHGQ